MFALPARDSPARGDDYQKACVGTSQTPGMLFVVVVSCMFFGFLLCVFPLRTAFKFGGDEGYELLKGLMCSRGFSLYQDIWNDQPPLHTFLLSTMFKVFGPTLLGARLLAAGFGTLLFGTFFNMVSRTSGRAGAVIAALFLVASPGFLQLSVSVMLEVPAIGTGLLAAWMLFYWLDHKHGAWLFISGLIMGCAIQIKFTAGLLVPAVIVQLLSAAEVPGEKLRAVCAIRLLGVWLGGVFVGCAVIGFLSGEAAPVMWRSHFSPIATTEYLSPADFRLSLATLTYHLEGMAGAATGVVIVLIRRQLGKLAFPVTFLATSLTVHMLHRPYWSYYYLHILVPVAWLSGHGMVELFKRAPGPSPSGLRHRLKKVGMMCCGVGLFVCLIVKGCPRLAEEMSLFANGPRLDEDEILAKVKQNRDRTKWFYSEDNIYPFHARLLVPPELAVIPLKRLWSGQLTQEGIVACVKRYQPEQLLFCTGANERPEWRTLLESEYSIVYEKWPYVLFTSKGLGQAVRSPRPGGSP